MTLLDSVSSSAITFDLMARLRFSKIDLSMLLSLSSLLNKTLLLFNKLEIILLFAEFSFLKYSAWSSRGFAG